MNLPLEQAERQQQTFSLEQLDEIIEEDLRFFDAGVVLSNESMLQQFRTPKVVSQVISCEGYRFKMFCEGGVGKDDKPCVRMSGLCEDSRIQVQEEELNFVEMKNLLNIIIVKDLVSPFIPIKHVRSFADMCR